MFPSLFLCWTGTQGCVYPVLNTSRRISFGEIYVPAQGTKGPKKTNISLEGQNLALQFTVS